MDRSMMNDKRLLLRQAVRTAILFRLVGDTYQEKIDNNKILGSWTAADLSRYVSGKIPSIERLLELDAAADGSVLRFRVSAARSYDHDEDEKKARTRDKNARLVTMSFTNGINAFLEVLFNVLIKRFDGSLYEKDSIDHYPEVSNRANSLSFTYASYEIRKPAYQLVSVYPTIVDGEVHARFHFIVRNNHISDKFHSIPVLFPGVSDTLYFPYEKQRLHKNERKGQPYIIISPDGTAPLSVVQIVDLVEQAYAIQKKSFEDFSRGY